MSENERVAMGAGSAAAALGRASIRLRSLEIFVIQ